MPTPPPLRNTAAQVSLLFAGLGIFPLPFLGSLIGLVAGLLALYQRYTRKIRLPHDDIAWGGVILSVVVPIVYGLIVWYLYEVLRVLVCAAMLYTQCPRP
ncbi:MAG: hypothetical protein RR704_21360 [Stenotrophomonas sp.]